MPGKPAHGDKIILGPCRWARLTSPWPLTEPDTILCAWRERMLGLHDGHPRAAPAAA